MLYNHRDISCRTCIHTCRYTHTYGKDEVAAIPEALAKAQYGAKYDELIASGDLVLKVVDNKTFVAWRQVSTGEEHDTDDGKKISSNRSITASEYDATKELVQSLTWELELKATDVALTGSSIPAHVWQKIDAAIEACTRLGKDVQKHLKSSQGDL